MKNKPDEHTQFLEDIHLKNLKRKYAKIKDHPELTDYALELKREISILESN